MITRVINSQDRHFRTTERRDTKKRVVRLMKIRMIITKKILVILLIFIGRLFIDGYIQNYGTVGI